MDRKVALVTGASRGIGAAIAMRLAREGYSLVLNYLKNRESVEKVQQQIKKNNDGKIEVEIYQGDVSRFEVCQRMVRSAIDHFGHIDVLINNAGISKGGFLMTNSLENWWEVVHTNLGSVVNCCKATLPHFVQRKAGKIINISSASGIRGTAGNSDYSASKAAIIGFSKALAREVLAFGIIVNVVAPGFIDTDMVNGMPDTFRKKMLETVPVHRLGSPEEVAEVVAMLTGPAGEYIVGQTIAIDGGITM